MLGRFLVLSLGEVGTYPMSWHGSHVDQYHALRAQGSLVWFGEYILKCPWFPVW